MLKRVIEGFREMAAHAKPAGVTVLIESHGDFTGSADLQAILDGVGSDAFQLLWDAHHTFVLGKEPPAETWKNLGRYVRHTHLKDSVAEGKERRYVLTGSGEVPVRDQVQVLAKGGIPRLLLLRVGEEVAPGDRGPRDRLPPLREGDARVPGGGRLQGLGTALIP